MSTQHLNKLWEDDPGESSYQQHCISVGAYAHMASKISRPPFKSRCRCNVVIRDKDHSSRDDKCGSSALVTILISNSN